MIKNILLLLFVFAISVNAQILLEADGPGNTYELINSKLAPGYDVVENPECAHPQFGRHVAEVWDEDLKKYVFEFYIHVTPDNDRCINFDRQRMEIKTYDSSPDSLKGTVGETVTYKWKFKLPLGFQSSSSFTHIHQIKAVGGDDDMPIFTLTCRKGSPDKLELIHDNKTKVKTANLSLFVDAWVECTEVIQIGASGTYSMVIKKISDGSTLLSYSSNNIMTIRADNSFIRPKWGIYRSLLHPEDLRDEALRFDGFYIKEGVVTAAEDPGPAVPGSFALYQNYPNPFNPETTIKYSIPMPVETPHGAFLRTVSLKIFDLLGREIAVLVDGFKAPGNYEVTFNGSSLPSGLYFCRMKSGEFSKTIKLVMMK